MRDEILDDQHDLVAIVESAGWDVTETDLSVYQSPWIDDEAPEATVTITARKAYPPDEDDDSEYRVK